MQSSYLEQKIFNLNRNLREKIESSFHKDRHKSSKFVGERVIKSQPGKRVSFFPSRKNQGTICLESNLELAHAISLERDEDVLKYQTQAIKIFIDDSHFIIPDFIVKTVDSYEVHEIKPNIGILSPEILKRFHVAKNILSNHLINFKIFDIHNLLSSDILIQLKSSYQRIYNIEIDDGLINYYKKNSPS